MDFFRKIDGRKGGGDEKETRKVVLFILVGKQERRFL